MKQSVLMNKNWKNQIHGIVDGNDFTKYLSNVFALAPRKMKGHCDGQYLNDSITCNFDPVLIEIKQLNRKLKATIYEHKN